MTSDKLPDNATPQSGLSRRSVLAAAAAAGAFGLAHVIASGNADQRDQGAAEENKKRLHAEV
jgi:hypothetical protein